ncbi:MAG TPA: family 16 glycosylhydrolase [Cytophagaceae bacterium]|nr:family 16 glycosylhydrolase [Cytophagaceae bacterium]
MKRTFLFWAIFVNCYICGIAQTKQYKGAEVCSSESYLYGRFQVKMKSCEASGMLMSFFTSYNGQGFTHNANEIDIRILGRYNNEVEFNTVVGDHELHQERKELSFNPHIDFHIYSFDWTPLYIAWSVDGKEIYRQSGDIVARMNKPQKIMMNIWPSQLEEWTGTWNDQKLPLEATYEYVKYYSYNPETPQKFVHRWTDEFDKLNVKRWAFSSNTFEDNACEFDPANGKVRDGKLILSLTKNDGPVVEQKETKSKKPGIASAIMADSNTVRVHFNSTADKGNTKKENFKIAGVEIQKTKFSTDMVDLELLTSPMDPEVEYELVFTPLEGEVQRIKITKP